MKPILFSLKSCPTLGAQVAKHNHWSIGKWQSITFANSEIKVQILQDVKDKDVFIMQSISNPANDHLIELLFAVDALERQGAGSINVIIPYFGYARQNMQHQPGECVSLNVIVRMLEALKVERVITLDIHDEASSGIFNISFSNLSALPLLAKQIKSDLKINKDTEASYVIGSPDQGGVERARVFANYFYQAKNYPETVVVEKKRDLSKAHQSQAVAIFGEVNKKHVILVDDVSTSGRTILNAAKLCLQAGASEVSAAVVHPDFAKGVPKLIQESSLKHFFTTNTIEKPVEPLSTFPKIKIIDIAKLLVI